MSSIEATRYNTNTFCKFNCKSLHMSQRSMRFNTHYGQRNKPQYLSVLQDSGISLYDRTDYQNSFKLAAERRIHEVMC